MIYQLGQFCGIVGTLVTLVRPHMQKREQMLLCGILVNAMSALNFLLIGQIGSGVFLCLIAIVQSAASIRHERQNTPVSPGENILFFLLYMGFGFYGMITSEGFVWGISWHNMLQLLPILAALMLMLSVFAKEEQKSRVFLLFNGVFWIAYTAVIRSTTFFTTVASMASTAAALWKYRKKYNLFWLNADIIYIIYK